MNIAVKKIFSFLLTDLFYFVIFFSYGVMVKVFLYSFKNL